MARPTRRIALTKLMIGGRSPNLPWLNVRASGKCHSTNSARIELVVIDTAEPRKTFGLLRRYGTMDATTSKRPRSLLPLIAAETLCVLMKPSSMQLDRRADATPESF